MGSTDKIFHPKPFEHLGVPQFPFAEAEQAFDGVGPGRSGFDAWSLTSLQQRLVKTGGRLIKHGGYYGLLVAEGHLHWRLFGQMSRQIWALPVPNGWHTDRGCKVSGPLRKSVSCLRNLLRDSVGTRDSGRRLQK